MIRASRIKRYALNEPRAKKNNEEWFVDNSFYLVMGSRSFQISHKEKRNSMLPISSHYVAYSSFHHVDIYCAKKSIRTKRSFLRAQREVMRSYWVFWSHHVVTMLSTYFLDQAIAHHTLSRTRLTRAHRTQKRSNEAWYLMIVHINLDISSHRVAHI